MTKKYWMVGRPGTVSTYRHESEKSALVEAARLAKKHPDHTFYILEATKAVKKRPEVDVVNLDTGINEDDLLF